MPENQKPSNMNLIWADAGGKIQPTDQKIQLGWVAEIPPYQTMNYEQNRQGAFSAHVNQRGIAQHDIGTDYVAGKSYVQGTNGLVYIAKKDNTGHDPVTDTSEEFWTEAFVTTSGAGGGKRFIGFLAISNNFVAAANYQYYATGPLTATLPATASLGDAVVIAKNPAVTVTVMNDVTPELFSGDSLRTYIYTSTGWVNVSSGGAGGDSSSLFGPTTVTASTTVNYEITDYDAFSVYSVSASVGTATRTNNNIQLVIPSTSATQIILTVIRNGVSVSKVIAVGASTVVTPTLTYPSSGQTSVELSPILSATAFVTAPIGSDTHQSSQWQVATDSGFTSIVFDSGTDTVNKTSRQVVPALTVGTPYFTRVRYTGTTLGNSAWSPTVSFTTTTQYVQTPVVTVTGAPADVAETPTITGGTFAVVGGGSDSHVSTDWKITKTSDSSVVWSSLGNTVNKTSIIVPAGILEVNTAYQATIIYTGATLGNSSTGALNFTTRPVFFSFTPASAGLPYGGGYYAGGNILVDGVEYALIVSPKTMGGESTTPLQLLTSQQSLNLPENDGLVLTNTLLSAPGGSPAANFVSGLSINGYTDWYIPSFAEGEIMYRFLKPNIAVGTDLKRRNSITANAPYSEPNGVNIYSVPQGNQYQFENPTQTISPLFKTGGTEAFLASDSTYYWTPMRDTKYAAPRYHNRRFNTGYYTSNSGLSDSPRRVRAVRRVLIPT